MSQKVLSFPDETEIGAFVLVCKEDECRLLVRRDDETDDEAVGVIVSIETAIEIAKTILLAYRPNE
jgi:hypothetical protein